MALCFCDEKEILLVVNPLETKMNNVAAFRRNSSEVLLWLQKRRRTVKLTVLLLSLSPLGC
jgi:hypothetical protein